MTKQAHIVGMRVPQHVVYRAFAAETVLLNLQTGKYHGLNPTAGRMLELIDQCGDSHAAALRVAEEYGEPLEKVEYDLLVLCADLEQRGLLERDADSDT